MLYLFLKPLVSLVVDHTDHQTLTFEILEIFFQSFSLFTCPRSTLASSHHDFFSHYNSVLFVIFCDTSVAVR